MLIGTYYLPYSLSTRVAHQFQAGILGIARLHWLLGYTKSKKFDLDHCTIPCDRTGSGASTVLYFTDS